MGRLVKDYPTNRSDSMVNMARQDLRAALHA